MNDKQKLVRSSSVLRSEGRARVTRQEDSCAVEQHSVGQSCTARGTQLVLSKGARAQPGVRRMSVVMVGHMSTTRGRARGRVVTTKYKAR